MTDKKLGEWIEEEISITAKVPEVSEDGKSIKYVDKEIKATQKVMYVDPPKRTVICSHGKHDFYPQDPSRGLFACNKCDYKFKTYPVSHEFYQDETGGHLRSKRTHSLV